MVYSLACLSPNDGINEQQALGDYAKEISFVTSSFNGRTAARRSAEKTDSSFAGIHFRERQKIREIAKIDTCES